MSDRDEEMWLCPECGHWVGYELDECVVDGHSQPRFEIRTGDVAADHSRLVARASVLRRLYWKLKGLYRRRMG